jgi:hypothetical protein
MTRTTVAVGRPQRGLTIASSNVLKLTGVCSSQDVLIGCLYSHRFELIYRHCDQIESTWFLQTFTGYGPYCGWRAPIRIISAA